MSDVANESRRTESPAHSLLVLSRRIRGNFFDKRRKMEDAIPQVLLVKSDYLVKEVLPGDVFQD